MGKGTHFGQLSKRPEIPEDRIQPVQDLGDVLQSGVCNLVGRSCAYMVSNRRSKDRRV
jgi:hypothetical protein